MIKAPKTVHDVRGSRIKCVNFQKCPLCYGCRRYSSTDPNCIICITEDKKKNVCNVELHRDDLTAKMITKEEIKLNEITFKNNSRISFINTDKGIRGRGHEHI